MGAVARRVSTFSYLLVFSAALLVPLLLVVGFLLAYYATSERTRLERQSSDIAQQASLIVDGEVDVLLALLKGLASSSSLAREDFANVHAEASRLVAQTDQVIVLRTFGSEQLLNSQLPFSAQLPPAVPV